MKKINWEIYHIILEFYWPLQKLYDHFRSLIKEKNNIKIFCIGNPKTGTRSLHSALKILGYKTPFLFDWPTYLKHGDEKYVEKLKDSNYNAFADFPIGYNTLYKKIEALLPESKFILTIRDNESFKKSFSNYYKNHPYSQFKLENLTEKMMAFEKRNKEIISHFKNRKSNFLMMNIIEGDGWEKLCAFLDKPIPNRSFPYKNKSNYK